MNRIHQSIYDAVSQRPFSRRSAWRNLRLTLTEEREVSIYTNLVMGTATTTILRNVPRKENEQWLQIASSYPSVRFCMRYAAAAVSVLVGSDDGRHRVLHQMEAGKDGRWMITLRLQRGTYRYRYYAQEGVVTTYVRPDETDDAAVCMDGFDAVLRIPSRRPRERRPPAFSATTMSPSAPAPGRIQRGCP